MWVPPVSRRSLDWEAEEEEDGMSDLIHNFAAWKWKRKRDASLEQASDESPKWSEDRVSLARMRVRRCKQLLS